MRSTFHGLETSKRALFTQSTALNTMGHNIANAATEGYSRQRVNMAAGRPLAFPGLQRENTPGQLGTGVVYTSITRVRDNYLDLQFRRENQQLGMWDVHDQALKAIEKIINEPSKSGLSSVMDKFWNSLEVLNRDPQLLSARIDFIGSATNMANTLHHMDTSLDTLQADAERNIEIKLGQANSLINNIAQLNDTIRKTERMGDHANDYRDQRDLLLDQLSGIVDMQYTEDPNGMVSVYVSGNQVVNGITATPLEQGSVAAITSGEIAGYKKAIDEVNKTRNQLNGLIDTLVNGKVDITLPNGYTTNIDRVAKNDVEVEDASGNKQTITAGNTIPAGTTITSSVTFEVNGFNGVHELGYTMEKPSGTGLPFFTTTDGSGTFNISNIQVNPEIAADTNKIAASGKYELDTNGNMVTIRGNGDIAHALAGLRDKTFTYPSGQTSLSEGTTDDFFRAMVSELGTSANNATRNYTNQMNLVDGVNFRRSAVSGVDTNEEIADMIRFQHAYNAAARNMTAIDEMLDRIINQMGVVGR
ncbi:flagellar hook-associated protein FlgK [Paenibacillus yanchengensis]|uniref:Flagellar hook-associated protein 1 n=1 Tax=Paenibacillus yanchengensis TaxID=2035833 RepID=A0ABW4YN31_9BACL